jgi:replication factor A1
LFFFSHKTFSQYCSDYGNQPFPQVANQYKSILKSEDIVQVTEGNVNSINDNYVLIVAGLQLYPGEQKQELPVDDGDQDDEGAKHEIKTPGHQTTNVAGTETKGITPPSSNGKKDTWAIQPVSSLNPYMHGWAIKAKVMSKGPKRSFNSKGNPSSVFSAELVDHQGTAIEGTFWRDAADRYYDLLEEGKAYVFARGSVKPANKNYARTRNDYSLHFDSAAKVEESQDDQAFNSEHISVRMQFVAIDQLAAFVDKRMPVDIVGVVLEAGPLNSIKRKADATEVSRRDVTIADKSLKSVGITLWGGLAEGVGSEIESEVKGGSNPVVAISSCKVSGYNGISLSTLSRSQIHLNSSDIEESADLKDWWAATGKDCSITPIAEGMPNAGDKNGSNIKPSDRQQGRERVDLTDLKASAPTTPDSKPVYRTVKAALVSINPQQTMWYLACPENNRKVVEQDGGGFYCEYDGQTYSTAVRRYIMQARFADDSGELPIQVFNDQAEKLIGQSADALSSVKESNIARYTAILKDAAWGEWVLRVKAQAQEYNGEVRQRYAVADIQPIDFVAETKRTLEMLGLSLSS